MPGSRLAELFVDITGDDRPINRTIASVHSGRAGPAARAGRMSVDVRAAFLGLAGVAAPLAFAVRQAGDLEKAFGQVRKTTGLAGDDFAALRARLERLATTMAGISLDEVLSIAEMAGRLCIQGVEGIDAYTRAIAMIKVALDDIPAEEAATSIARILNVFRLGPEAALSFASALNKLDDSSTATGRDILDVAQRLSGAAATLGMTPQKVLALAAAVKDAGIENEVAGSAFSQILMKMASDTSKFAKVAGVSAKEFADALRADPLRAIKMLLAAIAGMEKLEQFKALETLKLDGVRTGGSLLQLGRVVAGLDGMVAAANSEWDSHASILKEVSIKAEQTWAQLQLLWNNVRLTAESVGVQLLPVLKEMATIMGEVATATRASVDEQRGAVAPWVREMIDLLETSGIVWRNWADIAELSCLQVMGSVDQLGNTFHAFLDWFAANWTSIFVDAVNGSLVALADFAEGAKGILGQLMLGLLGAFLPPGMAQIAVALKPALKAVPAMAPPFAAPGMDPAFAAAIQGIEDRIAGRELKHLEDRAKAGAEVAGGGGRAKPGAGGEGKAPADDKAKTKGAQTQDLAAFARELQEGAFGKDKTGKAIARNTELAAKGIDDLNKAQRRNKGGPGFAVGPA